MVTVPALPPMLRVVVEIQVGVVPRYARIWPAVAVEVVARAPAPLPYTRAPGAMFAQPVPPLATARVPPRVRVPLEVIGPPVSERPVVPPEPLTLVTYGKEVEALRSAFHCDVDAVSGMT